LRDAQREANRTGHTGFRPPGTHAGENSRRCTPSIDRLTGRGAGNRLSERFSINSPMVLGVDSAYSSYMPDETVIDEASQSSHPYSFGRVPIPHSGDLVAHSPRPPKGRLCLANWRRHFCYWRIGEASAKRSTMILAPQIVTGDRAASGCTCGRV
jgi:hypothetical protein